MRRSAAIRLAVRFLSALLLLLAIAATPARPAAASAEACTPGSRSLAEPGSRVYPQTGNGGYTSEHTEVDLLYDTGSGNFLPGNHVVLTDRALQCLSSLSLDFERSSADKRYGPEMQVESIEVDGRPASFAFVQPTYPGDPNGMEDPDPRAHEASQTNPVGGPSGNPLPPACSPEIPSENAPTFSLDGTQCPADKLVITPPSAIPNGSTFIVDVHYSGRPGAHDDGEGGVEGWFHTKNGSFMDTEPLGDEAWMPLNDYPSEKPTYTFHETVPAGMTAVANGILTSHVANPPDSSFPGGSTTWNWEEASPVASYLIQSSTGSYEINEHLGSDGVVYYAVQDEGIRSKTKRRNSKIMQMQEEVTAYEARFNGPFPFASDGSLIGTPAASLGQEELEGMISFTEGVIPLKVLWHENMHQWWGDNVSEASYEMTFFKEGLAEWAEAFVFPARKLLAGAFDASLAHEFDKVYGRGTAFWTLAPSKPFPYSLFSNSETYLRPAAAYEALRRILGEGNFTAALKQIQTEYGGSSISEPELEAVFREWLPSTGSGCDARLQQFFTEWFDTEYSSSDHPSHPRITGPGLAGEEFFGDQCPVPAGPVTR